MGIALFFRMLFQGRLPFVAVTLFTIVETVTMVFWLKAALAGDGITALVILVVGLEVEHILAYFTGKQ